VKKSEIFHTPLYSTPPLGGFPSDYRHPLWYGKLRMVSLPDGEKISKISSFVLAQLTNVTDGLTDTHRVTAYTALMYTCMHPAVKSVAYWIALTPIYLDRPSRLFQLFLSEKSVAYFLSRVSILTRHIDIANLSVCPSVRPLRSGIRCKRLNISSQFFTVR